MVHRDISPGNLMLTYAEGKAVIKILDFGLAKVGFEQTVLDETQTEADHALTEAGGLTHAGQLLGTPDFIAPEQITNAQGADIRADIYSLGCTLYYLLSGRPPFRAAKLNDVLRSHHATDARPLNLVRPEVPIEVAAVVANMMAKEANNRIQTPREVAKALVPFFAQRSASAVAPNIGVVAPSAGPADSKATPPGTPADAVPSSAPAATRIPVRGRAWASYYRPRSNRPGSTLSRSLFDHECPAADP